MTSYVFTEDELGRATPRWWWSRAKTRAWAEKRQARNRAREQAWDRTYHGSSPRSSEMRPSQDSGDDLLDPLNPLSITSPLNPLSPLYPGYPASTYRAESEGARIDDAPYSPPPPPSYDSGSSSGGYDSSPSSSSDSGTSSSSSSD